MLETSLIAVLIQHGTTIALFNRVKSQTSSTRYLSVIPDMTRILGSDGKPVLGAPPPAQALSPDIFHGFTAHPSVWESFIIWLVDPTQPGGPGPGPPLHRDWPVAPANAIPSSPINPSIRYNSTVVLQSLQTGICTPVLILRRIEQDAEAVGGDGAFPEMSGCCPPKEMPGDLVSQLQKIAFELYKPDTMIYAATNTRYGGLWLSCETEGVREAEGVCERFVQTERKWMPLSEPQRSGSQQRSGSRPSSVPSTPNPRFGVLPMTPHTSSSKLPSTPSSPVGGGTSLDCFGTHSRKASSTSLMSPISGELQLPSIDGGPVRRQRTGSASRGPMRRPIHRKRQSADSASSAYGHPPNASTSIQEALRHSWSLDVGDVCVWSIVSSDQVSYTFYVPPYVKEITEPIAPLPSLNRLILSNTPMEMGPEPGQGGQGHIKLTQTFTSQTHESLITL